LIAGATVRGMPDGSLFEEFANATAVARARLWLVT